MIKIEREFTNGYAKPVNRGVFLWNGNQENREGPEYWPDDLVYQALGEEDYWSNGYHMEGIKVTIEVKKATRQ